MERLIFTNAREQQIEFKDTGTYQWINVEDLGGMNFNMQTSVGPYQDGASLKGTPRMMTRILNVSFIIMSDDVMSALRELNSILNPKHGDGTLIYERDGVSRMLTRVRARKLPSMLGGMSKGKAFQFTSIILEAFDPYYKDVTEIEAQVASGGNLFEFPVNITESFEFDYLNVDGVTIQNNGDVETPVTVILDGPKSSPLEIENETTGEKIVLDMDLLADERLTITTEIDNINVIKTDLATGDTSVAFQYIDVGETTFFNLALGSNKIKVVADDSEVEDAVIKYSNRYVGV